VNLDAPTLRVSSTVLRKRRSRSSIRKSTPGGYDLWEKKENEDRPDQQGHQDCGEQPCVPLYPLSDETSRASTNSPEPSPPPRNAPHKRIVGYEGFKDRFVILCVGGETVSIPDSRQDFGSSKSNAACVGCKSLPGTQRWLCSLPPGMGKRRRCTSSVFKVAMRLSAMALSRTILVLPIEGTMPTSSRLRG
jgi:hypothetical protein